MGMRRTERPELEHRRCAVPGNRCPGMALEIGVSFLSPCIWSRAFNSQATPARHPNLPPSAGCRP